MQPKGKEQVISWWLSVGAELPNILQWRVERLRMLVHGRAIVPAMYGFTLSTNSLLEHIGTIIERNRIDLCRKYIDLWVRWW